MKLMQTNFLPYKMNQKMFGKINLKGHLFVLDLNGSKMVKNPQNTFAHLNQTIIQTSRYLLLNKTNGAKLNEQNDILNEAVSFYKTLYKQSDNEIEYDIKADLSNVNIPKLSKVQSDSLEGLLNIKEVSTKLKNMKGTKTQFFKDVKMPVKAGMQFGTSNYKIKTLPVIEKYNQLLYAFIWRKK